MPKFLVPHNSGVHRVAAIALFRALLTQCRRLDIEAQQSNELQNIIRNRFKQQRHVTSHRQLKVSFTAGYEAIDHLDNAVAGLSKSKQYILDLLQRAPPDAKRTPKRRVTKVEREAKRKERAKKEREKHEAQRKPDIFTRPLPLNELSGKRHVPILVSANHIPILRYKKPQPHALSVYINSRVIQRQKRHNRRHRLEDELALARREDAWDTIVSQHTGVSSRTSLKNEAGAVEREPLWMTVPKLALTEVQQALDREREKNTAMATKMQDIVDKERALYEREQAQQELRSTPLADIAPAQD